MTIRLNLEIEPQPDDATCGPAALHAVYRFHGDAIDLARVIGEIPALETGGTLAVGLATHALRRGYAATIYTYNLSLFDPTWFDAGPGALPERLRAQAEVKPDPKLRLATRAYLDFLSLGGVVRFEELNSQLISRQLDRERPILTGLSATYLYGCARETGVDELVYDDVRGHPIGHFVILHGFDPGRGIIHVADPFHENPRFARHYYEVSVERVMGAIFLGALTHDANLLVLDPPEASEAP